MKAETVICDWAGCSSPARFHIEVPVQSGIALKDKGSLRLPFSHTHQNICGTHLDEYSLTRDPKAIYGLGKCPHCTADVVPVTA